MTLTVTKLLGEEEGNQAIRWSHKYGSGNFRFIGLFIKLYFHTFVVFLKHIVLLLYCSLVHIRVFQIDNNSEYYDIFKYCSHFRTETFSQAGQIYTCLIRQRIAVPHEKVTSTQISFVTCLSR